jgi:hypothetical protein
MPGELQGFRVDKIDICGRNCKDDAIGLRDVFGNEVARLLLDVCGLVADGYLQLSAPPMVVGVSTYLCQSRQVDQRQAQDVWRVYLEIYG